MAKKTKKEVSTQKLGSEVVNDNPPKSSKETNFSKEDSLSEDELNTPGRKAWHIVVLACIVFLSVLAVTMAGFFSLAKGSFSDIRLGSLDIKANASQAEIEKQIEQAAKDYRLTVQYPKGHTRSYALPAIGISVDAQASAENAKKILANSLPERFMWWKPINLELVTKTNEKAFQKFIETKATETKIAPKNATLTAVGGNVKVIAHKQGKGNAIENVRFTVPEAIAKLDSTTLVLKETKLIPKIAAVNLKNSKKKVESILSQKVTFNVAGQAILARPADIAAWLELTPVEKAKTVDVTVNSGKILEYIEAVAAPYVQPPRSKLIMKTDGNITVLDPGSNGIDVINKNQSAANVAKQLLNNKSLTVDLEVKYASSQTVEVQPYDKWIVVDTTTKRMYAYEKTKLVRTFLISAGAPETPTVLGKYAIYAKYKSQDMTGANVDGSRYFQPAVPYVNYFYADYAIHGNYWRPTSYFGNINSSHGCVGVMTYDGAWIYNWAPIGTTVFVHT